MAFINLMMSSLVLTKLEIDPTFFVLKLIMVMTINGETKNNT